MVGERIKTERKRAGFTQQQVADRLGVTAQAVSKWENDHNEPNMAQIGTMCLMFGCTTADLIGYEMAPYSAQEREMISLFRRLPDETKKIFMMVLKAGVEGNNEKS